MELTELAKGAGLGGTGLAVDPEDWGVLYNVTCVYALGDKTEDALARLDKTLRHDFGNREWLENDNALDSLRPDSWFEALLRRL